MAMLLAAACTWLGSCAPDVPPEISSIERPLRRIGAGAEPPPDYASGWAPVSLPDYWDVATRLRGVEGWYRGTVRLVQEPDEPWGVLLPRIAQNAAVWVNGEPIGDGGPFTDPLPRNWNRPQLFAVPRGLLRPGDNVVAVRIRTHPGAPGYLRAIEVGPLRVLRPIYEAREWLQVGLAQIVGATTIAAGLVLLAVSFRFGELAETRWLAAGLLVWAWSGADAFVRRIPVSAVVWEWSTGIAPLWAVVCFVLGFRRVLRVGGARRDGILVGVAAAASIAVLAVPPVWQFSATIACLGLAAAVAVDLVAMLMRVRGTDARRVRRRFLVPAAVGTGFGVHDLAGVMVGRTPTGLLLSPYVPVVPLFTTAWVVLGQLVDVLRETAALNRDLEARVQAKGRELERNYAQLAVLERGRAIASERERLMHDVHDGVGGALVSALALVETGDVDAEAVGDALRGALEDLRLVIDSLDPNDGDVLAVLATARSRLEPRLARHGLRFVWQVTDLPPVAGFGPELALQAMRIVQEAVTNVVKHARARTITVRTAEAAGRDGRAGILVEVRDDGRGVGGTAPAGRGLANMARRAARLGGTLDVVSDGAGTAVRLWLPCERPGT